MALVQIIAILIVLIVIAGFTLQSDWGRDRLVLWLNSRLNTSGDTNITIGRVNGNLLKSFGIDRITVADSQGVWLDLRNTNIEWNAWSLYRGTVDIASIEASVLTITRKPITETDPEPDPGMPDLTLLKHIQLEHFKIPQIKLDHSIMGQSALLSAHWNLTKNLDGSHKADLEIMESKHKSLHLILIGQYQPQSDRVSFNLEFNEPANGLMANLLSLKHTSNLSVQASGSGLSRDWSGTINAQDGSRRIADLEIGVKYADQWMATLSGKFNLIPLRDAPLDTTLIGPIFIDSQLTYQNKQLEIVNSTMDNSLAKINFSGTISVDQINLNAHLSLKPDGIDELERYTQSISLEQSTMTAKFSGSTDKPEVSINLTLLGPRIATVSGEKLSALAKIEFDPDENGSFAQAKIESTGEITKVRFNPNRLAPNPSVPVPIESLNWSLNASYNIDDAIIGLHEALLSAPFGYLRSNGTISLGDKPGDIRIKTEIGQLSVLSTLLQQPISGSVILESNLTLHNGTETISATLNGQTDGLSLNNAALDPLLGPKLSIKAKLNKTLERIWFDEFQFATATMSLTGNYEFAPDSNAMNGAFRFSAPQLTPYSALLGMPITGSVLVDGVIGGSLEQATISGLVNASNLTLNQIDLGHLKTELTSAGIPRHTSGSVRFDFEGGDLAGTHGSTHFDLGQDESMNLDAISVRSRGAEIKGKMIVPAKNLPIRGAVTVHVPSLADWSDWLGVELSGSTTAKIDLSANDQAQIMHFDLDASNFSFAESFAANQITFRGKISDLLVNPSGNTTLTANDALIIGAQISNLSVQTQSANPSELRFNAAAQGNLNGPMSLNAEGQLSRNSRQLSINLSRFSGLLAGQKIKLRNTLKFIKSEDQLQLKDLSLAIGNGSISGNAKVSEKDLNASLAINNLALAIFRPAGPQSSLNGSLSGTARIYGPRRSPRAQLDLQADPIKLSNSQLAIDRNYWLKIHGDLQNDRFRLNADIGGFGDDNPKIALTLPVHTTTDASLFRIAPLKPISGSVSWRGEMTPIWTLISDNEDRFEGARRISCFIGWHDTTTLD